MGRKFGAGGRAGLVCALATLAFSAVAGPSAQAAVAAGTNIGNAGLLVTSVTGSLGSNAADDWWVMYPAADGGTVSIQLTDTSAADAPGCTSLQFSVDNTDGTSLASGLLDAGSDQTDVVSSPASDRYYVEIDPGACSPTQPTSYTVQVLSGGGGPVPAGNVGTTSPGDSIGAVKAALLSDTIYSGTLPAGGAGDNWYRLYKPSGKGTATVRFENTVVNGTLSGNCLFVLVSLDNADGTSLDSARLANNTAVTYSVQPAGTYYIEVTPNGCGASGQTYNIEPDPAAAWAGTPTITKISPSSGSAHGGTVVTIHGTWLAGAIAVRFGNASGKRVRVISSTELTVIAPAHAKGSVTVTVTTGAGRSATARDARYTFR